MHKNNKIIIKKIIILTSKDSWFLPYAKKFQKKLKKRGYTAHIYNDHNDIKEDYDIGFILSYFKILDTKFLMNNKRNYVIHESELPKGRGWAPLFWQILEGKNKIPIVLFEADNKIDTGKIYFKDYINLEGHELYREIRTLQAQITTEMCFRFLSDLHKIKPYKQTGIPSYYPKRTRKESKINIQKSIAEQFNLLRTVDNEKFPAYFYHRGCKYILKIERDITQK